MELVLMSVERLLHCTHRRFCSLQSLTGLLEPCAELGILAFQFIETHFKCFDAGFLLSSTALQ